MASHGGHRATRPPLDLTGRLSSLVRAMWRFTEARILFTGIAGALVLVLVGALLPGGRGAAASGPQTSDPTVAALVKLVAAQGGSGLTAAQRDRAAATAWLAAMQQLAQLVAADRNVAIDATPPTVATNAIPPAGPIGVVVAQQAALDEGAARRLLAALPSNWSHLQKAALIKNNDRIGNRDDEWSRADRTVYGGTPRATAVALLSSFGFGLEQWGCLDRMWWQESNWRPNAADGATYGIPQALPGTKMAAAGADWRSNPTTQIRWGLAYIAATYGTPCNAWTFWSQHYWY
jgi:hypothetical protein